MHLGFIDISGVPADTRPILVSKCGVADPTRCRIAAFGKPGTASKHEVNTGKQMAIPASTRILEAGNSYY
jgi:hypothetical protein